MSKDQYKAIGKNWQAILSELVVEAEGLAQSVERRGKLGVDKLVQTLVLSCLEEPAASLQDMVQVAQSLGVRVGKSSLHERLTHRLVMVLAALLDLSLKRVVALPAALVPRLQAVRGVYIVDSTQVTVCPALYESFGGSGGVAKLKTHVVLEYLSGGIHMLENVAGRQPDQRCPLWSALMQPNGLYLFDLGYFKQETLRDLHETHAFYLTRCQSQVALYEPTTLEALDLNERLKRERGDGLEVTCRLGSRVKTPVRLVARRLADEVAAARRRHAKQKTKAKPAERPIYAGWTGKSWSPTCPRHGRPMTYGVCIACAGRLNSSLRSGNRNWAWPA